MHYVTEVKADHILQLRTALEASAVALGIVERRTVEWSGLRFAILLPSAS